MEPIKLSQTQLLNFLKEVGVEAVEIVEDDVQELDYNPLLEVVDKTRGSILKPRWETEVKQQFERAAHGNALGSVVTAIARETGMDRKTIEAAETYPAMIKLLNEHNKTAKKGDEVDVTKVLEDALAARDSEWQERVTPIEKERDEWKGKYTKRERIEALQTEFKDLPFSEKIAKDIAATDFDNYLDSQYDREVKEGKTVLYEKGTQIPAMKGSQVVKIQDVAREFGKPRNWFVESMAEKSAVKETNARANGQNYVQQQENPNLTIADKLRAGTQKAAEQAGIVLPQ
jgi:hypothetical protein